jgi:hypothetical protein
MKPALQLRLSQHLALTPQLQQSIKLLQLSTVEMQQEIERYLLENPMLERDDEPAAKSFASAAQQFDSPQTSEGSGSSASSARSAMPVMIASRTFHRRPPMSMTTAGVPMPAPSPAPGVMKTTTVTRTTSMPRQSACATI